MSIDSTVRAAVTVSVMPPLVTVCPTCASWGAGEGDGLVAERAAGGGAAASGGDVVLEGVPTSSTATTAPSAAAATSIMSMIPALATRTPSPSAVNEPLPT
jgi:hypothetical protein